MKKGTSVVLLSIISVLMAIVMVFAFIRFPVGTERYNSFLGAIELDYGMSDSAVYTLELDKTSDIPTDMNEVMNTISSRLNDLGYKSHSLKAVRNADSSVYDIRVEINPDLNENYKPDTDATTSAITVAAAYGELKFFAGTAADPTEELFKGVNPIEKVEAAGYNSDVSAYICNITFTQDAYDELLEIMGDGDLYFKITLGDEELSPFDGHSSISKDYFAKTISVQTATEAATEQMVLQITSGGLAYKYNVSEGTVLASSVYGTNVATVSLITVLAVLVAFIVAFAITNKGFGLVSALSMIFYMLTLVLILVAVPGYTLSVGGVFGIILATVFVADGMVMLIKRIKEEFALGKTVKSAIKSGYKRALLPSLNAGVIAVVSALALFLLGFAEVKLFAMTFGISVAIATFTALVITRMFVAIILPLVNDKEKFLNLKREDA